MAVLHPTKEEFAAMLQEQDVLLVDFFATWCGPCKMVGPIIEKMASKYEGKVKVIKIDIDQEQELTAEYSVQTVPTILVIKDGKILERKSGFLPQPKIVAMLDAHL